MHELQPVVNFNLAPAMKFNAQRVGGITVLIFEKPGASGFFRRRKPNHINSLIVSKQASKAK